MCPSTAEPRLLAVVVDRWQVPGGGLEAYLQTVLPLLAADGSWEVVLCAVGADRHLPSGCLPQVLREPWRPRPWSDRQLARDLQRRLAKLAPDIVLNLRHLPIPGAIWLPMGGLGWEVEAARGRSLSFRRRTLLAMEREAMQQACLAVPSSPKVAAELARACPELPQITLPLPLLEEPRQLAPRPEPGEELRVVACGRDAQRHGAKAAVLWWLEMRALGLRGRLDLWGKSPQHLLQEIGEGSLALASMGIHLHGWDGLFASTLEQAHLLLHPTLYDSFSLVCLEAAAQGVPVVTTEAAGVAAFLPAALCRTVERDRPAQAAQVALELLEGNRRLAAEKRLELASELQRIFSLESHIERLQELFAERAMGKMPN